MGEVLVTGTLGDSTAGLYLLKDPSLLIPLANRQMLINRYHLLIVRLKEAQVIARLKKATAMIDLSDGLSSDINHICDKSNVGVRLWTDRLPISSATRKVAQLVDILLRFKNAIKLRRYIPI